MVEEPCGVTEAAPLDEMVQKRLAVSGCPVDIGPVGKGEAAILDSAASNNSDD